MLRGRWLTIPGRLAPLGGRLILMLFAGHIVMLHLLHDNILAGVAFPHAE